MCGLGLERKKRNTLHTRIKLQLNGEKENLPKVETEEFTSYSFTVGEGKSHFHMRTQEKTWMILAL